ncbi:MAG TPA: GNAT family N-acetyltransferase [Bacteroidales bacterium]|nr:GNAT family N-acetyltransferase [Bacteroidales bacterium]HQL70943.1 GNAT family N-acetyltransferase [Bacteroidales bacterium]
MRIRNYTAADYKGVENVWGLTGMGGAVRGDTPQIIDRTLACGGALFLLVDDTGNEEVIAGTSWVTNDGRRLYLHHCGLLPGYQGKKLSHLLVEPALRMAKQLKMQIKLEVHRENLAAKKLYSNAGFTYLGDYDVHIVRDVSKLPF